VEGKEGEREGFACRICLNIMGRRMGGTDGREKRRRRRRKVWRRRRRKV